MRPDAVRFDAADLVNRIERLSQYQLDTLPFGVILLDRDGAILLCSRTEAEKSGYGKISLGENLSKSRRACATPALPACQ